MANLIQNPQQFLAARKAWNGKIIFAKCLVLLFLNISLVMLGGFLFQFLESSAESSHKCGVKRLQRNFIESLWAESLVSDELSWKSSARRKLSDFENQLYEAVDAGVNSNSEHMTWNFANSAIHSISMATTIGFDHLMNTSQTGRFISVLFSLLGSPLFFSLALEVVNGLIGFSRPLRVLWSIQEEEKETVISSLWRAFGCLILLFVFMFATTLTYSTIFQWSPTNSFYFVATTTLTTGNIREIVPEDPAIFLCVLGFHLFPGFVLYCLYQVSVVNLIQRLLEEMLEGKISNGARTS